MRCTLFPLILLLASLAHAQAPPGYQWRTFPDESSQIALWKDGKQLGNYRIDSGLFFRHHPGGGFDDMPSEPPAEPPAWAVRKKCGCCKGCACKKDKCKCTPQTRCDAHCDCQKVIGGAGHLEPDGTPNYGLELQEMPKRPRHVLNGKEVTKAEIFAAIGAPKLPDDARWLCVTAIGPKEYLDRVTADFENAPELAPWKGKIKFKAFEPSHWAVANLGFVSPSVYLEDFLGNVLWREIEGQYSGAAAWAETLRKKDPNYDPNRDPTPNKPAPSSPDGSDGLVFGAGHLLAAMGAGIGGLGCFASFAFMVCLALVLLWRHAHTANRSEG